MTARLLDGKTLAADIRAEVATRAEAFLQTHGRRPKLAAILVGDDPASISYARMKGRWAEKCGIDYALENLGQNAGQQSLEALILELSAASDVDAILLEMPLPGGYEAQAAQYAISPDKDVEGVTPVSLGRLLAGAAGPKPATAEAIMGILRGADIPLEGKRATVVGRSLVVGKPVALLLLAANATVTVAHTRTRDLDQVVREADIVVAAAGSPRLISAEHVHPGAVVIDAGTTMVGEGDSARLTGDADFEALLDVASAITPVPGGVGPVTTAVLLRNAVELAEQRMAGG